MAKSVSLKLASGPRVVEFGWPTLERIDKRFDESVFAIGERLAKITGPKELRAGWASEFVSACLDIPVDQLPAVVGDNVFKVFMQLAEAFTEGVSASIGSDDGGAEGNVPESVGSGPGLSLSSGSGSTSSTGSTLPSSETSERPGSIASADGTLGSGS